MTTATYSQALGRLVALLRIDLAWTQPRLAAESALGVYRVQRIEQGAPARVDELEGIAAALRVTLGELVSLGEAAHAACVGARSLEALDVQIAAAGLVGNRGVAYARHRAERASLPLPACLQVIDLPLFRPPQLARFSWLHPSLPKKPAPAAAAPPSSR